MAARWKGRVVWIAVGAGVLAGAVALAAHSGPWKDWRTHQRIRESNEAWAALSPEERSALVEAAAVRNAVAAASRRRACMAEPDDGYVFETKTERCDGRARLDREAGCYPRGWPAIVDERACALGMARPHQPLELTVSAAR